MDTFMFKGRKIRMRSAEELSLLALKPQRRPNSWRQRSRRVCTVAQRSSSYSEQNKTAACIAGWRPAVTQAVQVALPRSWLYCATGCTATLTAQKCSAAEASTEPERVFTQSRTRSSAPPEWGLHHTARLFGPVSCRGRTVQARREQGGCRGSPGGNRLDPAPRSSP